MTNVYTAPDEFPDNETNVDTTFEGTEIFLAGSIEMGAAKQWQQEVIERLQKTFGNDDDLNIYNPRAKSWNADEVQDPRVGTVFNEQVTWELRYLLSANIVVVNLEPETTSPISLFELGMIIRNVKQKIFVVCPKEFYRYGNVKIVTQFLGNDCHFYESRSEEFYTDLELSIQQRHTISKP